METSRLIITFPDGVVRTFAKSDLTVRLFNRAVEITLDPARRATLRTIAESLFEVCESLRMTRERPSRWRGMRKPVIPFGTQVDKTLSLIPKKWLDEMELIVLRLIPLFTSHIEMAPESGDDVDVFWQRHETAWSTTVLRSIYDLAAEYGHTVLDDPNASDIIYATELLQQRVLQDTGGVAQYTVLPHRLPEAPERLIAFKLELPRGIYTVDISDGDITVDKSTVWTAGIWW